jgi:hypothetical protein
MKTLVQILLLIFLSSLTVRNAAAFDKTDELNKAKMEQTTKEILEIFKSSSADKSKELKKYISGEWVKEKRIKLKNYSINNYSPDHYSILSSTSDICIALIGGETWEHLLVFKFTVEYGSYKVVPTGISKSSNEYIDPWIIVSEYICKLDDKDKTKDLDK